ncbi:MAG TPA: sensor domain-containing diguanylate cyclase [Acidimicrobiales bacterium]|nr:sensor domain-containing diguanylate cyclase [Acidimicrobiales bacterium]
MGRDRALVRSAAWLFVIAGLVTLVASWVPGRSDGPADALAALALGSIVMGAAVWLAPWERWDPATSLLLAPLGLGLVSLGAAFGPSDPSSYGVYFVVVFAWVGLVHPRRTCAWLAPLAAAVYVAPLLARHQEGIGSVLVTVPVAVLVGETAAWAMAQVRDTRRQAEHRANLLRAVANGTTTITALDADDVVAGVVDSVAALGFEVAYLARFDRAAGTWTVDSPVAGQPTPGAAPSTGGMAEWVRRARSTVTAAGAALEAHAPELTAIGARSAIGCPVWVRGVLVAALVAATTGTLSLDGEDADAVTLLANHAGRALENAERFGEERRARELLAEVSVRDELTGVGNRRHAVSLLDALQPGDAVIMIDLDHFKEVNDTDGHPAGDRVLLELADHLRTGVRDADLVARYGGEEFLVVVRGAGAGGSDTAERLIQMWRDRSPRTTFSAGVAVHGEGSSAAATVAQADAALYAAKRTGRDRVCVNRVEARAAS